MDKRTEILCRIFITWVIFEEWALANTMTLTDYEIDMFKWLVIFSAHQDLNGYADTAPEEVLNFIEKMIGGEDKKA